MTAITSSIDTASPEFRANEAAMHALTAELQERRAKAAEGGPLRSRNVTCRVANSCRARG